MTSLKHWATALTEEETSLMGDTLDGDNLLIVKAARIIQKGITTRSNEDALSVITRRLALVERMKLIATALDGDAKLFAEEGDEDAQRYAEHLAKLIRDEVANHG